LTTNLPIFVLLRLYYNNLIDIMSYEKLLGEALAADLSDLEGSDCITVYRRYVPSV
jgi:hypothetical protein